MANGPIDNRRVALSAESIACAERSYSIAVSLPRPEHLPHAALKPASSPAAAAGWLAGLLLIAAYLALRFEGGWGVAFCKTVHKAAIIHFRVGLHHCCTLPVPCRKEYAADTLPYVLLILLGWLQVVREAEWGAVLGPQPR
jgi:hypothetical protein